MHRAGILGLVFTIACGRESAPAERVPEGSANPPADTGELTAADRKALGTMSPLPATPADPTNAVADDVRAARLGQMLFYEDDLSGPILADNELGKAGEAGQVSCRTCHAGPALDDVNKHISIGTKTGSRNSPPVLNSVFYRRSNWGGKFETQWALVVGALEKPDVMNAKRAAVVEVVRTKYREEFESLFGTLDGKPVDTAYVEAAKAIAAYMRLLVARNAPFDRWIAGDEAAISPAAKRGAHLFVKHCKSCHDGPHFTDDKFHALAAAQFGEGVPAVDLGRFGDVPEAARTEEMRGQFRTPTLRNVSVTAPYMHAGQFATLDAVMAFYNAGGGSVDGVVKDPEMKRLDLSIAQQKELVAFMETLTDTTIAESLLVDTSR